MGSEPVGEPYTGLGNSAADSMVRDRREPVLGRLRMDRRNLFAKQALGLHFPENCARRLARKAEMPSRPSAERAASAMDRASSSI